MSDNNDKIKRDLQKLGRQVNRFWQETYPGLSREEKVAHWSRSLGEGLRWQEKNGGDPYAVFTPEALGSWRLAAADFDELLPEVVAALGLDLAEVRRRFGED